MNEKENADSQLPPAGDLRQEAERRLRRKKGAPAGDMAEVDVRALLHELQVHQIELEMQNEELQRAQAAAQEVSDKYHDLFDFAPVGYFLLDAQGRILELNLAGAALLGLDRSAALKQRFGQSVMVESRARFAALLSGVLQADARQACEIELQRNDELLYAVVEGVPVRDSGANRALRVTVTDITARKRAERERERLLAELAFEQSRLAELFERSPAFMCVLRGRQHVFERANEEYFGLVGLRDILGKPVSKALPELDGQGYFEILDRVYATGEPFVGKEMPVLLRQVAAGPLEERFVDFLYQPLREADGSISGIFVHGVDVTEEVQARKKIEEAAVVLRRSEALLRTRVRLSELAQCASVDELIQIALDEAEAHTGSCIGFFHLVDADQQNLTLQAWSTNTLRNMCRAEGKGLHYAISQAGVWVDCFHARKPVIHNDYAGLAHKKGLPEGHAPVLRDLAVPVFHGERMAGIIGVGNKTTDYTQGDADVLESLGVKVMDLVRYKRAEEALREAKAAAEAANLAKSRFLANMSHELRTPMNGILGMTELALRAPLDATVRDYLQTAHESADTLLGLLNDILDFSRIEAGRFELERGAFSLRATLEQTVKMLAARAYEKGVELICDVPSQVPDRLLGDALRLRQSLTNLIGNATKFTHQGEIVVRVESEGGGRKAEGGENDSPGPTMPPPPGNVAGEHEIDDPSSSSAPPSAFRLPPSLVTLHFSVQDTGIGMSAEEQERIFTPFAQAEASTTRRYGGTGLGLSITQSIVAMMGGRLWVESQRGQGSTFHFTARLALEPGGACPPDADIMPLEQLRGAAVLVVDDNATNRRILEDALLGWGMKPELAESAPAALVKLHEAASAGAPFPVFLIDAMLPEIDGFTLVQWIRENSKFAGAAIMMLSPVDRQVVHERAKQLDIAAYLEKPVTQRELLRVIAKGLGVGGRDEASARRSVAPAALAKAARSLRILLAEDNAANQKVALAFLGQRGHTVEVAQHGLQAIEKITGQPFDVALLDVQMPEMDGFEATAAIRGMPDPRKAKLPIVAMTAHVLKGDKERCLAAGMDAYISKPVRAEELIATVERLAEQGLGSGEWGLEGRGKVEGGAGKAEGGGPKAEGGGLKAEGTIPNFKSQISNPESQDPRPKPQDPSPVFDLQEALSRCGQYDLVKEMMGYFFEEADAFLQQMRTALGSGDAADIGRAAHKLRGTVCYLGAQATMDAAQQVEEAGTSGDLAGAAATIGQLEQQIERLKTALAPHRTSGAS